MTAHGPPLWLASQSPRRAELLRQLGVEFERLLPDTDETEAAEALEQRRGRESPLRYVTRVTQLKLVAALERRDRRGLGSSPVLAADTTVACGAQIHGKPIDADDAARILGALAGSTHRVLTAVSVGDGQRVESAVSRSIVRFAPLSAEQIRAYVDSGEPFGKAGAYAIQGRAAAFVEHIAGSPTGIVGLPLYETARLLAAFNIRP